MKKKIVILGASGFIGQNCLQYFKIKNIKITKLLEHILKKNQKISKMLN